MVWQFGVVERLGDIWPNEGFATYAEWLWDASHGGPSTAETFQKEYDSHPNHPAPPAVDLWSPAPAALEDPADLFGPQGYLRGSMTLEALRQKVGSHDFFVILRKWAQQNAYGNVSTPEFIALSERVSGQNLDALFKAASASDAVLLFDDTDHLFNGSGEESGRFPNLDVNQLRQRIESYDGVVLLGADDRAHMDPHLARQCDEVVEL